MSHQNRPQPFPEVVLDVFGQNERLSRLYTQLCFCFPRDETSPDAQDLIAGSLKKGLEKLYDAFPWTAGHVIQDDNGIYKIVPPKYRPKLQVRYLQVKLPSMNEYRTAGFPFSLLDEKVIAPERTLPQPYDYLAEVFLVQANFVEGGLLLVMMGQHNCMDMAGLGQVMYLLSKACQGAEFTEDELRIGNLTRENIMPLIVQSSEPKESAPKQTPSPSTSNVIPDRFSESKPVWTYFIFSGSDIATLKAATKSTSADVSFISTDDVLSAVLWQAWTRARNSRLQVSDTSTTFLRLVNVRQHLGLPAEYIGMAVSQLSTTLPVSAVCDSEVGHIASELRKTLNTTDLERLAKASAAAAAKSIEDRKIVTPESKSTPDRSGIRPPLLPFDIKMSSWAKEKCYDFDFGPGLGKPEAVRRPAFEAWEGLGYLMPKKIDGEIAAAVCIREDDLEVMKSDALMSKHARFVG